MHHFGIICSPVPGHLTPMSTLGRELKSRGHRVTVFGIADVESKVRNEDLEFEAFGTSHLGIGAWEKYWKPLSRQSGLTTIFGTSRLHTLIAQLMCQEIPDIGKQVGITALLIDQVQFQGAAIAARMNVPFISVPCAIALNPDASLDYPPPFVLWPYAKGNWFYKLRNLIGYRLFRILSMPIVREGNKLARKWGLKIYRTPEATYSSTATLNPMPPGFDFPRTAAIASAMH